MPYASQGVRISRLHHCLGTRRWRGGERPTARRASNDVAASTLVEATLASTVGLEVLEKRKIIFCEI